MSKKIFALVLTVLMAASLAACGSSAPKWETTSDAEAFAQSANFTGEFFFAQGGDYTFEMIVDWETGNWQFKCECPAAPNAASHVDYSGTDFEFDPETNTFSFLYLDDATQAEVYFYSSYDATSNTYYINMYRNFHEYVETPCSWTPEVQFVYAE